MFVVLFSLWLWSWLWLPWIDCCLWFTVSLSSFVVCRVSFVGVVFVIVIGVVVVVAVVVFRCRCHCRFGVCFNVCCVMFDVGGLVFVVCCSGFLMLSVVAFRWLLCFVDRVCCCCCCRFRFGVSCLSSVV